jgi:hypothetical protein
MYASDRGGRTALKRLGKLRPRLLPNRTTSPSWLAGQVRCRHLVPPWGHGQDVRSLGWLLAHLADRYGDPTERVVAPPGDLAGLARSFVREHRLHEALDCLEAAADRPIVQPWS